MRLLLLKNSKWIKGITLVFFVLFFHLLTISSAEAAPSYSDTPTFCPAGYGDSLTGTTTAGDPERICCPAGSEPVKGKLYCQSKSNGTNIASVNARSNRALGDREICKAEQYLVEKVGGQENYCLDIGEKITGGADNEKFFAGCKSGLPPFTLDIFNTNGTTTSKGFSLPLFCSGGGGLLVTNKNSCLCGDGTEIPITESSPDCSVLCSQKNGVLYDGKSSGNLPGICQGSECCHDDQACLTCVEGSDTNVYTALGCINTSQEGIVVWLIRIALILTTSIGVFRFVQASFLIRSGDPEKIKEGQEIVTSAIVALVLVLVSVPLLQFIGVNLLGVFPSN